MPRFIIAITLALSASAANHATAEPYPVKVIRIVTSEPGGGNDLVARIVAQGLTANLRQQVIVENRGSIAIEVALKATPDGYTLLMYGSNVWLLPFLRDNVPWDPVRDFAPVTIAVSLPNILVVHPSLPAKSVAELVALAKARPGELNYAAGTLGVSPHLAAELFKAMAGVNIVQIPYKGGGPALNGLIGGQTHVMFPNAGSVMPHLKAGRVRGLAVTTPEPTPLAPGLPTIASSGVPGYEWISTIVMFAPSRTPSALVSRLNREIVNVLNTGESRQRLFSSGAEVVASSPQELAARITSDMAKMGKVIRDAGIHE
jgi:tripartite-type tricarboxylate transporter receptor subunit TctC